MGVPIHGVAAPVALIRAASRRDYGYGGLAVMISPGFQITRNVYAFPVRPGLCVEIRQQVRGTCVYKAVFPLEYKTWNCSHRGPIKICSLELLH